MTRSKKIILIITTYAFLLLVVYSCGNSKSTTTPASQTDALVSEKQQKADSLKFVQSEAFEIKKTYILHYNNGKVAHNAGEYTKAIQEFDRCIELNDQFKDAWGMRGLSKYKMGDREGACMDWNKALVLGYSGAAQLIEDECK